MIEGVVHFKAELEPLRLCKVPPLLYAHVPIHVARCTKVRKEPRRVAEREGGRLRERRGIDPVGDGLMIRYRADSRNDIGALIEAITGGPDGVVGGRGDGDRQSRVCG